MTLLAVGCYTLQPTRVASAPLGSKVAFDVNDTGRVALGGSMAPEIAQIEGKLMQRDSTEYVIAVSAVRTLRGGEQVWGGEPVRIKSSYISSSYQRRLSRGRTVALSVAGVGALAILVSQTLLGKGDPDLPGEPGDTASTRRVRP